MTYSPIKTPRPEHSPDLDGVDTATVDRACNSVKRAIGKGLENFEGGNKVEAVRNLIKMMIEALSGTGDAETVEHVRKLGVPVDDPRQKKAALAYLERSVAIRTADSFDTAVNHRITAWNIAPEKTAGGAAVQDANRVALAALREDPREFERLVSDALATWIGSDAKEAGKRFQEYLVEHLRIGSRETLEEASKKAGANLPTPDERAAAAKATKEALVAGWVRRAFDVAMAARLWAWGKAGKKNVGPWSVLNDIDHNPVRAGKDRFFETVALAANPYLGMAPAEAPKTDEGKRAAAALEKESSWCRNFVEREMESLVRTLHRESDIEKAFGIVIGLEMETLRRSRYDHVTPNLVLELLPSKPNGEARFQDAVMERWSGLDRTFGFKEVTRLCAAVRNKNYQARDDVIIQATGGRVEIHKH